MNLKNKETQLFESLNKLDSIADLIKTSKEESSYLKKLSHQLEKEKEELGMYVTDHPVNGIWDILSKKIDLYYTFKYCDFSGNSFRLYYFKVFYIQ